MRLQMELDLHNYKAKYVGAESYVQNSNISQHNKDLILKYRDACLLLQVCGKVRLIRVLQVLVLIAELMQKDFDQAMKDDLVSVVSKLMQRQPAYSAETLATYRAILKKFMSWVIAPDQFPNLEQVPTMISWLKTSARRRDIKKIQRKDLLTPSDVNKLLYVCHNARDKALVAMLWETGCRIAELGNLQIKHLNKQKYGYTLDVTGKTGQRNPMIVFAAPYLTQWINLHPFREDPDAPLWVHFQYVKDPRQMQYSTIRMLLKRLFARADINKPCHPHIWRHSRATYCLANGIMSESAAKVFFGWSPSSDMIANYAHLIDKDANASILKENNLSPIQQKNIELQPIICKICNELNAPQSQYCVKCGAVLSMTKAYEHQLLHEQKDEIFINLFKILVEKGLVDEAAKEIHDAGLGQKLKRLVQHMTEERPITAVQEVNTCKN